MPLILKHDFPDRFGRKTYFVHAGALTVGHIAEKEMSGAIVKWHWGLINLPPVPGLIDHGLVDSRDAAMAELRKAWVAWLAGVGAKEIDAPQYLGEADRGEQL